MWLLPIGRDIVGCLPYIHFPFLLANRKLLWSGGILPSPGHESWPIRISPTYPVAQDWCKDGFGSTSGWQNVKTHLLGDRRKYFISEKKRGTSKESSFVLPSPCLVSCHVGIRYWIVTTVSHPWGEISPPYWQWQNVPSLSVLLAQVSCLSTILGPPTPSLIIKY